MVQTIGPVGYGRSGYSKIGAWKLAAIFCAALTVCALLIGLLLSIATFPLGCLFQTFAEQKVYFALGIIALWLAAIDLGILQFRLPEHPWQVPRHWVLKFSPPKLALLYGTYLGVPMLTYIPHKTFFFVLAASLTWVGGISPLVTLGLYGAGRGIAIALGTLFYVEDRRFGDVLLSKYSKSKLYSGVQFAWIGGLLMSALPYGLS